MQKEGRALVLGSVCIGVSTYKWQEPALVRFTMRESMTIPSRTLGKGIVIPLRTLREGMVIPSHKVNIFYLTGKADRFPSLFHDLIYYIK